MAATIAGRDHTIHASVPVEVGAGAGPAGGGICPADNLIESAEDRIVGVHPERTVTGEPIRVEVEFTADEPRARSLIASLVFCERVGHVPSEVDELAREVIHTGPISRGQVFSWECSAPLDALPTVEMDGNGLQWRVVTHVDRPGRDRTRGANVWVDRRPA